MILFFYLLFIPFFGESTPDYAYQKGLEHYRLAYEYAGQNNLDLELDHYLLAHEYLLSTDSISTLISVKKNLGSAFRKANNPTLAIKYYDEALLLSTDIQTQIGLQYNKARALKEVGRYDEALEVLFECNNHTDGVSIRKANIHNEIGLVLVAIEKYEESRNYFFRLINASNQLTDSVKFLVRGYHNVGHSYMKSKNYDEAVEYQLKAVELQKDREDYFYILSLIDLSESYYQLDKFDKASDIASLALELIPDNITHFKYLDAYKFAYKAYKQSGNDELSMRYQIAYEEGVNSYYNAIDSRNVAEQRLRAQRKYEDFVQKMNDVNRIPDWVYWSVSLFVVLLSVLLWARRKSSQERSNLKIIQRKINSI